MKKMRTTLAVLIIGALLPLGLFANDGLTGRQIAEKIKVANRARNRVVWAKMTVIDNGKVIEQRRMITKFLWKGGKERVMFRFMNGLKRNVTFLSIEKGANEDNTQYIYIPGVGRPRQVSSAEKQNDFEDTDFSNEDLGGRKVNDYKYKRLKDKKIKIGSERFEVYVLIAKHKDSSARYPKFRFYIDKKTLIPVKMKAYGRDRKLKKIGISARVKELSPGIYMPHFMYVKDLERKHETKMLAYKLKQNVRSVNARQFTPSNLSKPWRER